MKILWFNWRCWQNPAMGGAEVFTREVAKRWVQSGHEVVLFTSEFSGCKRDDVQDGITIVRSGGRLSVYSQARRFYEKHYKRDKFEIVIDEINTIPFFSYKFVNVPLFVLIHQLAREFWFYETPFPINEIGYHILEDRWLRRYQNVPTVTVSQSTYQDLAALGFKDIATVPEGINFTPLDTRLKILRKPIIVYAGRLKKAKRPDHAIKAFKIIKRVLPDAELWVIGQGPFKNELEKLSEDGVKFFSGLTSEQRRSYIGKASILVNPGLREGWGLNIIEANALGIPCVAYDAPGLRDSVIDGKTGLLASTGNINELASKSLSILTNEELYDRLSASALEYSRTFSWENTAKSFMKFINEHT
jgi:glycosyltransferase involved in cell wall biosynthesis